MNTRPDTETPSVGEPARDDAPICPGFRKLAGRCGQPARKAGFCWSCWNAARRWASTAETI